MTLGQVQLASAAEPADPEQLPIEAHIESTWQDVRLLGRGALPAEVSPGDRLAFDLYWQAPAAQTGWRWTARSQDPAEAEAGRGRGSARGCPVTRCAPGERLSHRPSGTQARSSRGRQNWQLDPKLPAGDYRLTVQMIAPDGASLAARRAGAVTVAGRPHVFAPPAQMAVASDGRIGDFARLLGFDATPTPSVTAGRMPRRSPCPQPQP